MKTRNKFEKRIARQLKRAKVRFDYETEYIPYTIAGRYLPDFILETLGGKVYIECKGYLRPEDKRKLVAVKRQHPSLDIRLLFFRLVPSYVRWAEKHGFIWAVNRVPKEWLQ